MALVHASNARVLKKIESKVMLLTSMKIHFTTKKKILPVYYITTRDKNHLVSFIHYKFEKKT